MFLSLSSCLSYSQNTFPISGNVGIGTGDPYFNLDINGNNPYLRLRAQTYTPYPEKLTIKGGILFNQENSDKTAAILYAIPPGYHVPGILFSTKLAWDNPGIGTTDFLHRMFIHPNGNIGIGTTDPNEKLSVAGTIHSQEVKVSVDSWADYVFASNYKLKPLAEVDAFIQKNNHLPDIPSEEQVVKNGIQLGEMNKLLLLKIEELTLYLIEKDKILIDLGKEIKNQKTVIDTLNLHLEMLQIKIDKLTPTPVVIHN